VSTERPSTGQAGVEDLLRELAPQVLGALLRRYGQFHLCEDASQEALLAAALQWPADGLPENPRGWLITVAARRLADQVRSEQSRRNREDLIAIATPPSELPDPRAPLFPRPPQRRPGRSKQSRRSLANVPSEESFRSKLLRCGRYRAPPREVGGRVRAGIERKTAHARATPNPFTKFPLGAVARIVLAVK